MKTMLAATGGISETQTHPAPPPAEQCRPFADHFAQRVAHDALLRPWFPAGRQALGSGEYAWWAQALAGRHYTGRPLHGEGPYPLTALHLSRWCELLDRTLDENFGGPEAAVAKGHVLNMATMLGYWEMSRQRLGPGAGKVAPPVLAAA